MAMKRNAVAGGGNSSPIRMNTSVRLNDDTAAVLAKVGTLTDRKMGEFAAEVVAKAKENASSLPFENPTGELAEKISYVRIGPKNYRIGTTSAHASFIELGTQYIKGKMPFLWPAYRWGKKRFLGMKNGKWL